MSDEEETTPFKKAQKPIIGKVPPDELKPLPAGQKRIVKKQPP